MQCSKIISKDVRAARRENTTHEPRLSMMIARPLFEILLLCLRRSRLERKATKNRSKIDKNPFQTDPTSTKNRSWVVLAVRSRFEDAPGCARDGLRTPKCHSKTDLGTPGARQQRPGPVQKRPRAVPETSQDPSGDPSEHMWDTTRRRTHLQSDFSSLLS